MQAFSVIRRKRKKNSEPGQNVGSSKKGTSDDQSASFFAKPRACDQAVPSSREPKTGKSLPSKSPRSKKEQTDCVLDSLQACQERTSGSPLGTFTWPRRDRQHTAERRGRGDSGYGSSFARNGHKNSEDLLISESRISPGTQRRKNQPYLFFKHEASLLEGAHSEQT